jgi:hypothetical protein
MIIIKKNKAICTANLIKLENTMLNGTINLGKYTLPKSAEFAVKTVDVFVRQSAK